VNCPVRSARRGVLCTFLLLSIIFAAPPGLFATRSAYAQDNTADLVRPGDAIVTGFSGVLDRSGAAGGTSDATKLFIDPDGASVRGFDISQRGARGATGQALAPEFLTITARQVGQVFGIALDDATNPSNALPAPNIYVTATSAYGLALVHPGQDGKPQRLFAGAPDAGWMDGQFGEGGGPGSIWKIDGLSGQVSLFANVTHDDRPNSGPGLGNIVFDPRTRQLFVSDRATGLIHRFSLDGADLGTFDHGVTGRAQAGLPGLPLPNKSGASFTSPAFKTADPSTWGLADPRRRVWGLAVWQQRLYYAVADESQVWSVGLDDDGAFDAASARFELKLADDARLLEIADITFTRDGEMILAQRPPTTGAPDFGVLAKVRPARLLRYRAETPDNPPTRARWQPVPAEYAVGITGQFRNAMGGVALGFGYDASGALDPNACAATVWATGDALRESPFAPSGAGGPEQAMASGIQGLPADSLRENGTPPADAFVVDFDGQFPRVKESGRVGDVAVAGPCPADVAVAPGVPEVPGVTPPAVPGPGAPGVQPAAQPQQADLSIEKRVLGPCVPGKDCRFELVVTNVGAGDYQGPLVLSDTVSIAGMTLVGAAPAPWTCGQAGDQIGCNHPTLLLRPGHSTVLPLTLNYAGNANSWQNCAVITWLGQGATDQQILRTVQIELAGLGYYGGPINGVADNDTRNAIRALQKDLGLPETGEITPDLLDWLFGQGASTVTDANPGNDGPVCVTVGPETPPTTDKDLVGQLQVEKTGPGKCDFNTLCKFGIKITNPTNQAIKVTAQAIDEMTRTHDGAALANSIPVGEAPGLCSAGEGPAGVAKTPLNCTADIDLGPNQSKSYTIGIKLDDPKLDPGNNANLNPDPNVAFIAAENCILLQIPGVPLKSCASVALGAPVTAGFDLAIEKSLLQAAAGGMIQGCDPNQPCRFTIRITNNGPGPYIGPLIVKDDVPAGWTIATWAGPTVCEQKGDVVSCSMAPQTTLAAGQSVDWTIGLQPVPSQSDQMVQVKNCAEIDWKGGPGDANSGNDGKVCADVNIPPVPPKQPEGTGAYSGPQGKAFDLTIKKTAPQDAPGAAAGAGMFYVCEPLKTCPFTVTITNIGIDQYVGPVTFKDTPKGWSYGGVGSGWTCKPAPEGFTCTGNVSLNPGQSVKVNVILNPMPGVPVDPVQGENCANLVWEKGKGDSNAGNDGPDCLPVTLSVSAPKKPGDPGGGGAPPRYGDIEVTKYGANAPGTGCKPGSDCIFNIRIEGIWPDPMKDTFTVRDVLPKGWTYAGGGPLNLWSCQTKGGQTSCTYDIKKNKQYPHDGFRKGDVILFEIRIRPPADLKEGTYINCAWVHFDPPPSGGLPRTTKSGCAKIVVDVEPKLTVEKRFEKTSCNFGQACNFTIKITNSGNGSFAGSIDLIDEIRTGLVSLNSAQYTVTSVTGGGDLKCAVFNLAGPICQGTLVLRPGESVVLKAKGEVEKGGRPGAFENCAIVTTGPTDIKKLTAKQKAGLVKAMLGKQGYEISSGPEFNNADKKALAKFKTDKAVFEDAKGNPDVSDKITEQVLQVATGTVSHQPGAKIESCDRVQAVQPGLIIKKQGPTAEDLGKAGQAAQTPFGQECRGNHECIFSITVAGNSDTPYTDPIVIKDNSPDWKLKLGPPKSSGWTCSGKTKFTCTHPPANLTRTSKPLELTVTLEPTDAYIQKNLSAQFHHAWWIHNCAKVVYNNPAQYNVQPRNEYESCYKLRLGEGKFDLSEWDFDATGTGTCQAPCTFYEFTASLQARLRQLPPGGIAPPQTDYDATGTGHCLPPNCGAPAAPASARTGVGYSAPMSMIIKLPPKAQFPNARIIRAPSGCTASGWSCTQSGREFGNTITCRTNRCTMRPGDRVTLRLDGKVAPELTEPPETEQTREVCGELQYQRQSGSGGIEQKVGTETRTACVTTLILARPKPPKPVTCPRGEGWKPYPEGTALLPGWKLQRFGTGADTIFCMKREDLSDLQVSTLPKGKCTRGQTCEVETSLSNVGKSAYAGAIEVRGQITPPVSIRGLVPSSGWTCRTLGGGRYSCKGKPGAFAPGASARIDFGLAVPRNFDDKQITHAVRIAWPGGERDANAANDSALFTIPIITPSPPGSAEQIEEPNEMKTAPAKVKVIKPCPGGKVRVPSRIRTYAEQGGICVCPAGTVEIAGVCQRKVKPAPGEVIKPRPAPPKPSPPAEVHPCDPPFRWNGRMCVPPACPAPKRWDGRRCACPSNMIERRGRCFVRPRPPPAPPPISCRGGTVVRGIVCVCPRGTTRQQRGARSYQCVPVRLQTIPGGRLAPAPAPPRLQTVPGGRLAPAPVAPRLRMVPGGIICPPKTKLVNGKCVPVVQ